MTIPVELVTGLATAALALVALLVVIALVSWCISAVQRMFRQTSENWEKLKREVLAREETLHEIKLSLRDRDIAAASEIAAVDIFVEKAQGHLADRAGVMVALSVLSTVLLMSVVVAALVALLGHFNFFQTDTATVEQTVVTVLHNVAVLGLFLGMVYLFASLLRAFLHEATVLNNRIHALRLGRLFIYIQFASAEREEIKGIRDRMAAEDIDRIFGWNYESSTAFKDIRPEFMTKNLAGALVEAVGKLARTK